MKSKIDRSSHRSFPVQKGVLKNFADFTGKHLRFSLKFAKFLGTPNDCFCIEDVDVMQMT